ncbi:GlxA family transcriptional regulator [Pelagibius sp. Alg239-R121]|uniref:GlxA family transcriptional regulator n=1 Tax=Pelagibius sp. Alg239-R121 TaxID=2993448 RepID=UPI0024A72EA5|nr:helix-turn-helix domain-containing protein [Pelagibius sp. Alg239-R121]
MTSFSANSRNSDNDPRQVVFVVYPDIVLLDLVGPLQVFSHALDPETGANGYECAVTSFESGMVETNTVISIPSEPISSYLKRRIHTLVVVGGDGANTAMRDRALLEKISKLASTAQRVCSVCSGALVLAATGILDGRRAVTHWDDCKTLEEEFPAVQVEIDPIYIKDGHVWTSAGITAGMDMALAIVAEDLGRPTALQVARSMVTHMARSGGQSQFSPTLNRQLLDATGRFESLHQWIAENLKLNLGVAVLAGRVNMSARNFSRLYSRQMGLTPAKAVEAIRTEAARNLLETTDLGMKQIAAQCGFNDEERMRRAFMRLLNVSPSDYRQGIRAA